MCPTCSASHEGGSGREGQTQYFHIKKPVLLLLWCIFLLQSKPRNNVLTELHGKFCRPSALVSSAFGRAELRALIIIPDTRRGEGGTIFSIFCKKSSWSVKAHLPYFFSVICPICPKAPSSGPVGGMLEWTLIIWKWSYRDEKVPAKVWGVWGGWKQGTERRKEQRRALMSIKAKLKDLGSNGGWCWLKIKAWRWLWLSDLLAESSRGFFLAIVMALRAACKSPKPQEERHEDVSFPITGFLFGGDKTSGIWVLCSREESWGCSTQWLQEDWEQTKHNCLSVWSRLQDRERAISSPAVCSVEAWAGKKGEFSWSLEHEIEQVAF